MHKLNSYKYMGWYYTNTKNRFQILVAYIGVRTVPGRTEMNQKDQHKRISCDDLEVEPVNTPLIVLRKEVSRKPQKN